MNDREELEALRAKSKGDEDIKRGLKRQVQELKAEIKHYKAGKIGEEFVLSDAYIEEYDERD